MTQLSLSLWTAAIVWIGFLDKAFLHTFIYRPICIAPLVGLMYGNMPMGLIVGVTVELMFLATVFVGTVTPPDEVTSAALAAGIACATGNLPAGIACAIPVGIAGRKLKQIRNNTAFEWTQKKLDDAAARASARGILCWATVVPSFIEGLFFAVPTFAILYFGTEPIRSIVNRLPYELFLGILVGSGLVGAVGIAAFLGTIKDKTAYPYFLIGFAAVAYAGIGITGVAVLTVAVVLLLARAEKNAIGEEISRVQSVSSQADLVAENTTSDAGEARITEVSEDSAITRKRLTRKDLWKTLLYSLAIESGCSTSKQEAPGFTQAMIPVIERVYETKEEKAEAYMRHDQLFLTEGRAAQFIVGVVAKLEEQNGTTHDVDPDSILLYKSALAGPLAGIGDSLLHGTLRPLAAGIACALVAASGLASSVGVFFFLAVMTSAVFAARYFGFFKGYNEGLAAIERMQQSGIVDRITRYANIASFMLAGAFIPALLRFTLPPVPWRDTYLNVQGSLDMLVPGLIPLLYTLLMYRLIYKKNISPLVLAALTLALGVLITYAAA